MFPVIAFLVIVGMMTVACLVGLAVRKVVEWALIIGMVAAMLLLLGGLFLVMPLYVTGALWFIFVGMMLGRHMTRPELPAEKPQEQPRVEERRGGFIPW